MFLCQDEGRRTSLYPCWSRMFPYQCKAVWPQSRLPAVLDLPVDEVALDNRTSGDSPVLPCGDNGEFAVVILNA